MQKKHNPGVKVQEIEEDPVASAEGLVFSASDLRDMISDDEKEKFLTYMPDNVDGEEVWESVPPK